MVPLHRHDFLKTVNMNMRRARKFLSSFFKRDWKFEDYPVYSCPWIAYAFPTPFPWQAFIICWSGMHAGGNTASDAIKNLRTKFESFKQENELPRPGRDWPPFSMRDSVFYYEELLMDFVHNILIQNRLPSVHISDDSTLMDFDCDGTTPMEYAERIRDRFGVDVSDISGGKLVDIFKRIAAKRAEEKQIDQEGGK
jgi:hypothetical protein